MFTKLYFSAVVVINACFVFLLLKRAVRERWTIAAEPGNPVLLALYSAGLQFLAAFGISDFSVSIVVYRKFRLVEDERLPGTLLTACVVPVAVMALGYLTAVEVAQATLLVCVLCGIAGAVVGTALVARLDAAAIRLMMALVLLAAGGILILRGTGLVPSGGQALGFHGWKLALTGTVTFVLTGLSMGGFAVSAMLLCFFYAMGLNPAAAFPLAMGTCTISSAFGGIRYVKRGNFSLKLALFSSLFGALGAFIAVRFVRNLDLGVLQWFITAVALYTAFSLLCERRKRRSKEVVPSEIQQT